MKCGIYCRISTDQSKQKHSLPAQKELGISFCESKGFDYKLYVEEESAKDIVSRDQFQYIIEDVEKKIVDKIWVVEFERLTRADEEDAIFIKNLIIEYNVQLFVQYEEIKFESPEDLLFYQMRTAVSAYERRKLIERLKRALKRKKNEGLKTHHRFYGYENIDNEMVVVQEEADTVRYIFQMYSTNLSYSKICERLIIEGHKRKEGGDKWNQSMLRAIVRKPEYIGHVHNTDNELIESKKFPPIVDREIWDKAQDRIKRHKKTNKKNRVRKYALSGVIRCKKCGTVLYVRSSVKDSKKRGRYTYHYYAHLKNTKQSMDCNFNRTIYSMNLMDNLLLCLYEELFLDPKRVLRILEHKKSKLLSDNSDAEREKINIENKISDISKKRKKLILGISNDLWEMDEVKDELEGYKNEIESYKSRLKLLNAENNTKHIDDIIEKFAADSVGYFSDATESEKKKTYLELFEYISVDDDILEVKSITGESITIDLTNIPPYWIMALKSHNQWLYMNDKTEKIYGKWVVRDGEFVDYL